MNLIAGLIDYAIPCAGRKTIHNGAITFILIMLGAGFISRVLQLDDASVLRVTTLAAAAMCSQLYMINAVVTSELFPTAIRNLAASFVQIASRTGAVLAPHLFYLAVVWPPLPFLVMLLLLLGDITAFTTLIPETKNSPMADHMPSRSWGRGKKRAAVAEGKASMRTDIPPSSAKLTEEC